jgi:hypothetical protein
MIGRSAFVLLAALSTASAGAETHRWKPTMGHATFAVRPPVLTVKPGDVLESESLWGEGTTVYLPVFHEGALFYFDWLVAEHGFAKADAYQLVSQLAVVRVANMVDPLYTVVAKFPKKHLPASAASSPR